MTWGSIEAVLMTLFIMYMGYSLALYFFSFPKRIKFENLHSAKEYVKEKTKIEVKPVKNTKFHYLDNTQLRMLKLKKLSK